MKHFLILINYTAPFESFEQLVPEHRQHLQRAVDAGIILFSGPRNPRDGGVVIARADSRDDLQTLIDNDPYRRFDVASYTVHEFIPGRHQPFLDDWLAE
jgi:uncharacterized protein YciI